ncbi:hypothetical protein ABZV67_38815 [Streptomyces sp. NPDC005065]|uniref:hypothetical protein n=1 Tax=Streptomyces sp. NPDC005065 TaxID=3154461 RepID=UPI0033A0F030
MTSRRTLGTGASPQGISAPRADLLDVLPGVRLPDLHELRARGVLGTRPQTPANPRRALGGGRAVDTAPDHLAVLPE